MEMKTVLTIITILYILSFASAILSFIVLLYEVKKVMKEEDLVFENKSTFLPKTILSVMIIIIISAIPFVNLAFVYLSFNEDLIDRMLEDAVPRNEIE